MLTRRGIYKDGTITFLEDPPEGLECNVLVNFLGSNILFRIRRRERKFALVSSPVDSSYKLSEKEIEFLRLASDGLSNQEIADILSYKRSFVSTFLSKIYRKLKVHSKSQAVKNAIDLGFLPQVQLNQDLIDEFGNRKQLSQREINVLHLFHEGLNKKEIAEKLGLTMNEVRHACNNITRKLRAQDMIQAIAKGLEIE